MLKEKIEEKNELSALCNLYLEHCYYEKGLSENSLRSYSYDLKGLLAYAEEYSQKQVFTDNGDCPRQNQAEENLTERNLIKQERTEHSQAEQALAEQKRAENNPAGRARTESNPTKHNSPERNLSEMNIGRLDRDFWHDYMAVLISSKKVKTVKRKLVCFTGFFYFLENQGIIETNPLANFKLKLKAADSAPETLSLKEMKHILNAVYSPVEEPVTGTSRETAEFIRCRDIAVIELLFATGLRVNELCAIGFSAYNREEQSLQILGKGGKERKLYICNSGVINALDEYIKLRKDMSMDSDAIFLNRWGKPLSCQAVRDLVRKYCEKAGIKRNITPHAFRHTFASLLLEEGVELRYIQEFLGHSSITTTQIYLHTSEKRKREILAKMHPRKKLEKIIK